LKTNQVRPDQVTWQLYAQGRTLWRKRGTKTLTAAANLFDRAIERDPRFAPAYSGLADCYAVLPFYSDIRETDAYPKSKEAAIKAVELDPTSAEAHTSLAYTKLYADWDFKGAETEFRKARPQFRVRHRTSVVCLNFYRY
jgi:serine/threonine-protein kinase